MRKILNDPEPEAGHKTHEKSKTHDVDQQLIRLLEGLKTSIKVVGTGGAGCNTVTRLAEMGVEGVETVVMNTDAQDLLFATADQKVLLGPELTSGLGAGADPSIGENAAKESFDAISSAVQGSDLTFITCGLGGGTGTGSVPIIAEMAKDSGSLTVAVVTLPFFAEGIARWENARKGLDKLRNIADTVIVIPNDKLLKVVPDMPLNAAFMAADEMLANAIKGTAEMITKPGLINLDFADLKSILSNGITAVVGIGESTTGDMETRSIEALEEAISSPLLDVDISGATRALVNVIGGPEMTHFEAQSAVDYLQAKIHSDANIIWGAQIDGTAKGNTIRVMLVISGIHHKELFAKSPLAKKDMVAEMAAV